MIKLIKRYPLISIVLGLAILAAVSLIYNRYQIDKIQLIQLQDQSAMTASPAQEEADAKRTGAENVDLESEKKDNAASTTHQEALQQKDSMPQEVPVYICGEVNSPGVYYVASSGIIDDVVKKCGGFTESADRTAVNLAGPIVPNGKIIIPKQGEQIDKLVESYDNIEGNEGIQESTESYKAAAGQAAEYDASETAGSKVNINTADQEALKQLPGIGDVKAAAIIAYREANGCFNHKEEIKNVTGIGDKTYEKLAPLITT